MILVDTHCHLYLPEFDKDRPDVLQRAREKGVQRFYLPAIDSTVIDDMLQMEKDWPGECFPMMGLHPCSVKENHRRELEIAAVDALRDWFGADRPMAVSPGRLRIV